MFNIFSYGMKYENLFFMIMLCLYKQGKKNASKMLYGNCCGGIKVKLGTPSPDTHIAQTPEADAGANTGFLTRGLEKEAGSIRESKRSPFFLFVKFLSQLLGNPATLQYLGSNA